MKAEALLLDPGLHLAMQPCPLCAGVAFQTLARHDRHHLGLHTVGCEHCGLMQINPRPSAQGLDTFYQLHYRRLYQNTIRPDQQYVTRFQKQARLQVTAQYLLNSLRISRQGRLLDYGCSEGSLFVALREAGFTGSLFGVEPNATFGRFAATQGHATVTQTLPTETALDGIVLNHVLEHLADPIQLLRRLSPLLDGNGLLYVDVPDAREYRNPGDLHLAHLWHFTPATLCHVIEQAGFEVVTCEAHRPPHHPRSIRLVARPVLVPRHHPSMASAEHAAWQVMKTVEQRAWFWGLRHRLAQVALLREGVRLLRRLGTRQ